MKSMRTLATCGEYSNDRCPNPSTDTSMPPRADSSLVDGGCTMLSCVENTLELKDGDGDIYSRYDLHFLMSNEQKRRLLVLCLLFSPDTLDDKCFFQSENIDSSNEFYELGQVQTSLAAVSNILIGGVNRKVRRIMIYKRNWMLRNYLMPLLQLKNELS